MPKGVEHGAARRIGTGKEARVPDSVMPKGVEHSQHNRQRRQLRHGAGFSDAERR